MPPETAAQDFRNAFHAKAFDGSVSVQDMMSCLDCPDMTIYARIKKMGDEFVLRKGRIYPAIAEEQAISKILLLRCIYIHKYEKKLDVTHPKWEGLKSPPFPFEECNVT